MDTQTKEQPSVIALNKDDFLLSYYIGHHGKFGHEYLDFEFRADGRLKYYNCTRYRGEEIIRKEVYTTDTVLNQVKKIISDTTILQQDDKEWPKPDKTGEQKLEIQMDGKVYKFTSCKIGAFNEVQNCQDPEGFTVFFYLVQDLKCLVFSLVNSHFRIKPV